MDLLSLLQQVESGNMPPEKAAGLLENLPYEDIGVARLDHHRAIRQGFPEVVYAAGKTPEQTVAIFSRLADRNSRVWQPVLQRKQVTQF